ncbi:MAG: family 10 glycosylhydrolase [Gemmatimonadaceae bacterium]
MPNAAPSVRRGYLSAGVLVAASWLAATSPAAGQSAVAPTFVPIAVGASVDTMAPDLDREFRAAWIATVDNIDWPSRPGLTPDSQRAELRALLDRAAQLHLNAVIFQVRPSADALYASALEPWSYYLTGQQGVGPSPAYDPLSFAVDEAHARGLELHAWFNPYRAKYSTEPKNASPKHVSRARPSAVRKYGPYLWMDPGDPWVRARTTRVIMDVVNRYDIDGVHLDDYFYPYPERARRRREIPFPDGATWKKYRASHGTLSRDDWRRDNVDRLVDTLYREIKRAKPWVKFGISPFGIWRPGYPERVRGFDSYEKLFADSRRWVNEGWADYFTPQLYWKVSAPLQGYGELLAWWRGENRQGRHIWPGNYTSRVMSSGSGAWAPDEILAQVRLTRESATSSGNIHFSMTAFVRDTGRIGERLASDLYARPALVPASPWLGPTGPEIPQVTVTSVDGAPRLAVSAANGMTSGGTSATSPRPSAAETIRWWTVRVLVDGEWRAAVVDARQHVVLLPSSAMGGPPARVVVTAVDRVGNESLPVVVPITP